MLDSLATLRHGARSWLGGLDSAHDFNPLLQTASGVYLTFFGSFVFHGMQIAGVAERPLRRV
jgi:NADPH:quinone reductase